MYIVQWPKFVLTADCPSVHLHVSALARTKPWGSYGTGYSLHSVQCVYIVHSVQETYDSVYSVHSVQGRYEIVRYGNMHKYCTVQCKV